MVTVLLAATAGGCVMSVEADIPEVEVTQHDLAFAGVPLGGILGDVSMTRSFSQKHEKLDLPDGIDSEVKALGVSLIAKNGVKDFGFIHNLRLTMSDDTHAPVELINYQQDANAKPSAVLTMQSANPVNTLEQWKTDRATFTIEVAGTLPDADWTVDLAIRFSGKVKYKY
jgi:hypothetical protein